MDFGYLDSWIEEQVGKEVVEQTGTGYRNIWVVAETVGGGVSTEYTGAFEPGS